LRRSLFSPPQKPYTPFPKAPRERSFPCASLPVLPPSEAFPSIEGHRPQLFPTLEGDCAWLVDGNCVCLSSHRTTTAAVAFPVRRHPLTATVFHQWLLLLLGVPFLPFSIEVVRKRVNQVGNHSALFSDVSLDMVISLHLDLELEQNKGDAQLSVETSKENVESKEKGSPSAKPGGKNGKDGGTDGGKEDYIHVRARRGQATNSHSLTERVTGKAVMLDEIINYVQSLQRQVELLRLTARLFVFPPQFLSMKLAAVNPRLDFNIEGLLSKEVQLHFKSQVGDHD
ncbi:hypothetical protein Taro_015725, partial [Colocasia esculenta]|nr:hypothetical protein [Colocasia esculenta]